MTSLGQRSRSAGKSSPGPNLASAWIALLFVPVGFVVAVAIAGGLYALTGHDPSSETPPLWADAVALVPAGLVFLAPCVVSVVLARRVVRAGRRAGYVPAALAVVAAVAYLVLNLLNL